jgi:hypothetical protein
MNNSSFARLDWIAKPRETVYGGPYGHPDLGCSDEIKDATAAYTHALIWVFTGQEAHAQKAAEILNAWSGTLKNHTGESGKERVQAAWAGSLFPLSAEILRSTYPRWPEASRKRFSQMLNQAFVPLIYDGMPTYNGNWELSMGDALCAIGVYNDDEAIFDRGVTLWRQRLPAYFYMERDGSLPIRPTAAKFVDAALLKYWHNPQRFVDGLCQETGRDFGHTELGLDAAVCTAEITYHQNRNLYTEGADRICAACEFHSYYELGNPPPSWLFGGKLNMKRVSPTYEIAYNHYHNCLHKELPWTSKLLTEQIRQQSGASFVMLRETLTHADLSAPAVTR